MYVVLAATLVGGIFALDRLGDAFRERDQRIEPQRITQTHVEDYNKDRTPFWNLISD